MRIISGKYRSRLIEYPQFKDKVRPTKDRVREAVFNILRNDIENKMVLDLFAGSGAYGLEAISNRCKYAYFVDKFNESIKVIKKNIHALGIQNYFLIEEDYSTAILNFKNNKVVFDIVFIDPPYKMDVYNDIVEYFIENQIISDCGIFVLECNKKLELCCNDLFQIKEYKYSDTLIYILRRKQ